MPIFHKTLEAYPKWVAVQPANGLLLFQLYKYQWSTEFILFFKYLLVLFMYHDFDIYIYIVVYMGVQRWQDLNEKWFVGTENRPSTPLLIKHPINLSFSGTISTSHLSIINAPLSITTSRQYHRRQSTRASSTPLPPHSHPIRWERKRQHNYPSILVKVATQSSLLLGEGWLTKFAYSA